MFEKIRDLAWVHPRNIIKGIVRTVGSTKRITRAFIVIRTVILYRKKRRLKVTERVGEREEEEEEERVSKTDGSWMNGRIATPQWAVNDAPCHTWRFRMKSRSNSRSMNVYERISRDVITNSLLVYNCRIVHSSQAYIKKYKKRGGRKDWRPRERKFELRLDETV